MQTQAVISLPIMFILIFHQWAGSRKTPFFSTVQILTTVSPNSISRFYFKTYNYFVLFIATVVHKCSLPLLSPAAMSFLLSC